MTYHNPKNSDDPEIWDTLARLRAARRELKSRYGDPCAECVRLLPKAHPSKLLPGQTCKIHDWKNPKPRLDQKVVAAVFMEHGLEGQRR